MAGFDRARRRLCQTLGLLAGGWLLWRFLTPNSGGAPERVRCSEEQVPAQGALVFRQQKVALVRSQGRVYALDLTCTHLGCTVNVTEDQWRCPCHGSRFDNQGQVLQGPAQRPLRRLRLQRQQGELVVYG